jgi:hypothetical protein
MTEKDQKRAAAERPAQDSAATNPPAIPAKASGRLKPLSTKVLRIFRDMQRDRLDLHVMFESSGNEPAGRAQVLDAVDDLVREGLLQSAGGDFYSLTDKGKRALTVLGREK